MTDPTVRDDNLRLVLSPVEKRQIDHVRIKGWAKMIGGCLLFMAGLFGLFAYYGLTRGGGEAVSMGLRVVILVATVVAVFGSPLLMASGVLDVLKAWRHRRDFEAFQRSYNRDPDAVKMPDSWTVE